MVYERVKQECEKRNMSIAELERLAKLGNGTVGRWQNGVSPTVKVLCAVAGVLEIDARSLIDEVLADGGKHEGTNVN